MNKIFFAIIFCVFYMTSCIHNQKSSSNETILVDIKHICPIQDIFEQCYSISLETLDGNLLSSIDKIQIENGNFYILDKKQHTIYIFDKKGFFIQKINRYGQGPMEYIDISDFMVSDSVVYILSRINRKIIVYNEKGEYIKNYSLNDFYDYFYKDKNDNLFLYSSYSNDMQFNFIVLDIKTGTIIRKLSPFYKNQSFSFTPSPFNISDDGTIIITQQYDYNIYSLNSDSLVSIYQLDFNTNDKIPKDYEKIGFDNIYKDLANKSVVKRITLTTKQDKCLYIIYDFEHIKTISKINLVTNANCTSRMEFNDKFPFIFSEPLLFSKGYLISWLAAPNVIAFDEKFKSDKSKSGYLTEDDNPVLFFHKLSEQ